MDSSPRKRINFNAYPNHLISDTDIQQCGYQYFMRNDLPEKLQNGSYIYNLDDKNGNGTHWTMFCLKYPYIYYVDSFGTNLNGYPPEELRDFGRRNGFKEIVCNEWMIQHIKSYLCGYYALYFADKLNKYFDELTPTSFDNIIHAKMTKFASEKNFNTLEKFCERVGLGKYL